MQLAAFEEDNNLAAASLLTRRELASKIKHSGKAASLGFATDDAVDAADRVRVRHAHAFHKKHTLMFLDYVSFQDALLAALERLRATNAAVRTSPATSPTRAARPLHASST